LDLGGVVFVGRGLGRSGTFLKGRKALLAGLPRAFAKNGNEVVPEDYLLREQLLGQLLQLSPMCRKQFLGAFVLTFNEFADLFVDHFGRALE